MASRKCNHSRLNETFLKAEIEKMFLLQNCTHLEPVASATESRQGSSPLCGASLVPRSASLTAFLRCGSVPVMEAMQLPFFEEKLNRIAIDEKNE